MQFLIIGKDGTDEKAKERRSAAREAHIKLGNELVVSGNMWYGAALWDDNNHKFRSPGKITSMSFPRKRESIPIIICMDSVSSTE